MARMKAKTANFQLLNRVAETIEKHGLLKSGDRVLVAVSGGADSMFLWWVLRQIGLDACPCPLTPPSAGGRRTPSIKRESNPLKIELHVAHLNHCLRKEALDDAEFVREQSDKLGIPYSSEEQDVKSYCQQNGLSLEQGARELRYKFLARVASEFGMNKIATGHTASDQVETFILRAGRGCGGRGLLLIPPKRNLGETSETEIIRPLIEITGEEIRGFLHARKMKYREDESNRDRSNIRNFIRHEVTPRLREVIPNMPAGITRLRDILHEEEDILQTIAEQRLREISDAGSQIRDQGTRKTRELILDLKSFLDTPLAIKRRVLRTVYARISNCEFQTPDFPTFDEVQSAITYVQDGKGGKDFHLRNLTITRSCGKIRIAEKRDPTSKNQQRQVELSVPGKVKVNGFRLLLRHRTGLSLTQPTRSKAKGGNGSREYFDAAKLEFPLFVRKIQNGDRMKVKLNTRICEKKLKEVLINDKVPVWERKTLPLLADTKGILWVVGKRRAHRALVGRNTAEVIEACVKT